MTRWVLGVDLGTGFSAGAVAEDERVELLEVGGERRVPSTVLRTEDGRLLAGTFAQRTVGRFPDRAERNPKRYVGRAPMLLGGEPVTAQDALAALLELFVGEARRRHDGADPARLVMTHPVAWTDGQRAVLRGAAQRVLPGVGVTLLEEPVAAAVHYLHDGGWARGVRDTAGHVAVYDLGAGTFDTAVLSADRHGVRVVGRPGGDPDIGGEAFDRLVYQHFGAQLAHAAPEWWEQLGSSSERRWRAAAADLLTEARIAKESLSQHDTASRYVAGADADVHLSRTEFAELIGDDVRRTVAVLTETVEHAGGELRGVFLAGGASRTPLVEQALRAEYDGLVRTWQDPKAVVALGAARWAAHGSAVPRRPAAPATRRPPPFAPIAEAVLDARVAAGAVYTWSVSDGSHRISRRDPRTGRVEREIAFGELTAWALSDGGLVVAEGRDDRRRCHVLGTDLTLRSSTPLRTTHDPAIVVEGDTAWAVLRSPGARRVDGSACGEVGELAVQVLPLAGPVPPPAAVGEAAHWFIEEDGRDRRLLDPRAPSTSLPGALGDGVSCALVVGRAGPRQTVGLVGANGVFVPITEQRAREAATPWVHQHVRFDEDHPWLVATSVGLETFGDLRFGTDRLLFLRRPQAGAVRWVLAGRQAYGIAVEQIVPGRGLTLHVLVGGRCRDLGRWPSLLGSPTSLRPAEAPRLRVDGDRIWVGAGDGGGGSHLVLADPDAARVAVSAPGWLEPVGRVGDSVLALHAPDVPPGDGRVHPAHLVRLRG